MFSLKNCCFILFVLFAITLPFLTQASIVTFEKAIDHLEDFDSNEKLYVNPGSVYVAPDAIYVNIKGQLFPVSSLEVDAQGIYVPAFAARSNAVECSVCHRFYNPDKQYAMCPHEWK